MSVWSKLREEGQRVGAAGFVALAIGIAGAAGTASAEDKAKMDEPTPETTVAPEADTAGETDAAVPEGAAASADAAAASGEEVDWEEKPYQMVDGKIDFGTYNGFRRYHSSCHVCHGPDALGSSYAPALIESIPRIGYAGFLEAVVNGIKNVNTSEQSVMPSFGEAPDVMNYIDDIYSYLKARADGVLPRGRPDHQPKPKDS